MASRPPAAANRDRGLGAPLSNLARNAGGKASGNAVLHPRVIFEGFGARKIQPTNRAGNPRWGPRTARGERFFSRRSFKSRHAIRRSFYACRRFSLDSQQSAHALAIFGGDFNAQIGRTPSEVRELSRNRLDKRNARVADNAQLFDPFREKERSLIVVALHAANENRPPSEAARTNMIARRRTLAVADQHKGLSAIRARLAAVPFQKSRKRFWRRHGVGGHAGRRTNKHNH